MGLVSKGSFSKAGGVALEGNNPVEEKTWGEQFSAPLPSVTLSAKDISWILGQLMDSKCNMSELESAVDVINKLTAMQKDLIARL